MLSGKVNDYSCVLYEGQLYNELWAKKKQKNKKKRGKNFVDWFFMWMLGLDEFN